MKLRKHARFLYQPVLPLGKNQRMVTNSKSHLSVSRMVAEEGTVLLKNDGTLPLKRGSRICLFGIGAGLFLLGGGGSGTVFSDTNVTLSDALLGAQKRGEIAYYSPLTEFYINSINRILEEAHLAYPTAEQYNIWRRQFLMPLPELPDELYNKAKDFGDTALFCVSRYSSEGDLNGDRKCTKVDFY